MNIYDQVKENLIKIVHSIPEFKELDLKRVCVEPPKDLKHGDMATNVAMVCSKSVGLNPRAFAEKILPALSENENFKSVEVAGPGFINIFLSDSFWQNQLKDALNSGIHFGNSDIGKGEKVNIEFCSANPTGPIHVGHSRMTIFGDCLSNLLQKAGYDVSREYYMNDRGVQIDKLAKSAYLRYREAMGEEIVIPEGCYPGDYLKAVGEYIAQKDGDKWMNVPPEEYLDYFKTVSVEQMMNMIKKDLDLIGVHFDYFASEKKIAESGGIEEALKILSDKGLIYKGVLEKPKSRKALEDWTPQEMLLFKSTEFGDDSDRPLARADGSYTYLAPDVAYEFDKYKRGFKKLIMCLGADHSGYVTRLKSALSALTDNDAQLDCMMCQIVNFTENGKPIRMSKRAGNIVLFSDLIELIGKDVARFYMMTRKIDSQLDFDLVKVREQSKDNPVFYVQYAYARSNSVFKHAQELFGSVNTDNADLSLLDGEVELSVIKKIAEFPRLIEQSALVNEPHRIAYYLYDLASIFHGWWNMGREDVELRFLDEKRPELSLARLALIKGVMTVIESGLAVFGVEPSKEM